MLTVYTFFCLFLFIFVCYTIYNLFTYSSCSCNSFFLNLFYKFFYINKRKTITQNNNFMSLYGFWLTANFIWHNQLPKNKQKKNLNCMFLLKKKNTTNWVVVQLLSPYWVRPGFTFVFSGLRRISFDIHGQKKNNKCCFY